MGIEEDLFAQQEEERKRLAATNTATPSISPDLSTLASIPPPTTPALGGVPSSYLTPDQRAAPPPLPAIAPMPDLQLQQPPEVAPVPLPPSPNLDSTHTSTTSTKTIVSPEYKANLAGQKANDATTLQTLGNQTELDKEIAASKATQAAEEAAMAARKTAAIEEVTKRGDNEIQNATAKYTAAQEAYRGRKIESYVSRLDTGNSVLAAVSVAFGTLGSGLSGGRTANDALKILEAKIQMDYNVQKANIEKEGQDVAGLRGDIGLAAQRKADKLNDLNAKFGAFYGELGANFRQKLAAKGVDAAQIEGDARVAFARDKQLQMERQALEPTMKRVQTTIELVKNDPRLVAANAARGTAAERAEARDENGKVIGHVVGGKNAAMQFEQHDTTFTRAEKNLQALYDDVKKNGERVLPGTDAAKRRDSLYANAVGAVAGTSPLGKTDEAVQLEKKAIGSSGAGTLLGASASVIKSKITEVKEQRQLYRRGTLIPVEGGAAAMADPGAAQKLSQGEAVQLVEFVRKNPNNPAAQATRQLLESQGWIKPRAN